MRHKQLTLLLFILISAPAWAGMIYKWRDNDGNIHYTDNPANIPLQQEQIEERKIEAPTVVEGSKKKLEVANGSMLWKDKCSSCHFITANPTDEYRRQISTSLLTEDTTVDSLAAKLIEVVKLRPGDMNNTTITETEAKAIATYLLQEANP